MTKTASVWVLMDLLKGPSVWQQAEMAQPLVLNSKTPHQHQHEASVVAAALLQALLPSPLLLLLVNLSLFFAVFGVWLTPSCRHGGGDIGGAWVIYLRALSLR